MLERNTSGVVLYVSGTRARLWKAGWHGQSGWELKRMCTSVEDAWIQELQVLGQRM